MTVAERIDRAIQAKSWTQKEAAAELGISLLTVSKLVNAWTSVTPEMAVRLATVFPEISAERLLAEQMRRDLAEAQFRLNTWVRAYDKTKGRRTR